MPRAGSGADPRLHLIQLNLLSLHEGPTRGCEPGLCICTIVTMVLHTVWTVTLGSAYH